MGGGDDQALHEILGARAHADAAFAAARLAPVGVHAGALQIAAARHRDGHVFHAHQVFELDFARILDDLGAALVAEDPSALPCSSLTMSVAQNIVRAQDFQVLGDAPLDVGQFFQDLLLLHAGEALQLQFDDGLRLLFAELEGGDQPSRASRGILAARIMRMTSSR